MTTAESRSNIAWLATIKEKNIVENESQHANFFTNTDVLTGQSILIRESIQNAIDAKDSTNKVKMHFLVGQASSSIGRKYFEKQFPRITKCLDSAPTIDESCQYILIEDFKTTGLLGTTINDLPSDDPRIGSYFYFTWATGKSNKKEGTRGKNGVGKIVFPKSSRIKSFLVLSSRDTSGLTDEPRNLLFGTSILKTHELDGHKWVPESHWMIKDDRGYHVPSSDESEVQEFISDWKLRRRPNEHGTSIVIPYCDPRFSARQLAQCITQDYFVAILDGIVEIEVRDESGFSVTLNSETIMSNLESLDISLLTKNSKSKEELLELCRLYIARKERRTKIVEFGDKASRRNHWDGLDIPVLERESIRNSLDDEEIVEFRVHTFVPETNKGIPVREDSFTVLVKRRENTNTPATFSREGILIPSANSSKIAGYLALVIVDSGHLADFLGDAEGPSHEKWSWEEEKFHGKYLPPVAGEETIKYVRQSVMRILNIVQLQENEVEDLRYANIFPISSAEGPRPKESSDDSEANKPKPVRKRRKKKRAKPVLVNPNYSLVQIRGGFQIRCSATTTLKVGDKFEVRAGYAMSSGNPLAKSSDDFQLIEHLSKRESKGLGIVGSAMNYLTLEVQKPDFLAQFEDFDRYRDLVVAVNDVN
ncbi:MAG TPA: hypothetical protein VMW30_06840 [Candidatus Paceibacterota bacterium]|nr:hypothetical protein [Candidatus Paceibacterota bacterium]